MNTDQITTVVRRWLRHTEATPPDAHRSARQVMARMPYVRQRGRWWPLPILGRRTSSARSTSDREQRFVAILDTTYRIPTVTGRTRLMYSPVKAIVVGALVFALGGMFLVARPFDQQGSVPGAEKGAELAPAVKAIITVTRETGTQDEGCTDGSGNALETCTCNAPEICTWQGSDQWSATDPRLSGTATTRATEQWWPNGGDRSLYPVFEAYAVEVVNDKGRWVGTARGAGPLGVQGYRGYLTLTGEEAYDGFTAVVVNDPTDSDDDGITTNVAVIIEGELPPFPELPGE